MVQKPVPKHQLGHLALGAGHPGRRRPVALNGADDVALAIIGQMDRLKQLHLAVAIASG